MRDKVKEHFRGKGLDDKSWLDDVEPVDWGQPTEEEKAEAERQEREEARAKRMRELEEKAEQLKQEAKDATDPRFDTRGF